MKRVFALTLLISLAHSFEVFLREITIYTTHESRVVYKNTPEVYFVCDDDRAAMMLKEVTETDKKYIYNHYQIPAAHLEAGECVLCTLKEYDLFKDDDTFGTMKLCADSFTTGASEVQRNGEYTIKFECTDCIPKKKEKPVECPSVPVQTHSVPAVKEETHKDTTPSPSPSATNSANKNSTDKGISTVTLVMATLMGFTLGVVVGAISLKYFSNYKREQETNRMRELNAILQQEIPFESLPKPSAIKTKVTSSEGMTYTQIPSENLDENA